LFISSTEEKHLKEILTALDDSGVLTVSDMPGFTRRGGMIQFVLEGDKVRSRSTWRALKAPGSS